MKIAKLITLISYCIGIAIVGVAAYSIYQGLSFFKPSQYAKNPAKGQTTFEKYFPNVAEVKDGIVHKFTPSQYAKNPAKGQTTFEKYFPNVAEIKDRFLKLF